MADFIPCLAAKQTASDVNPVGEIMKYLLRLECNPINMLQSC